MRAKLSGTTLDGRSCALASGYTAPVSATTRVLVWTLMLLSLIAWPRRAAAAPGFTDSCAQALSKEEVDELLVRMRAIAADGPCTLARVDTSMFQTHIEWRAGDQQLLVLLGPKDCVIEPSHVGESLAYAAPAELGERCVAALAGVRAFVGEPREPLVPVVRATAPPIETELERLRWSDPLLIAGVGWLALSILAGIAGGRAWSRVRDDTQLRRFVLAAVAMLGVAVLARLAVEPSLGNWYGAFLPAEGVGELRFGPSAAVLQALVRACTSWTVAHAFGLVRLTGALAVPLVMIVVRRLGGSLAASVIAGSLIALEPIPVRLSASSSEHVLAGTLALAAWAAWLRTSIDRSIVPRLVAVVALWLAVLARVDCWPQLAAIPLFTLLGTGSDTQGDRWRGWGDALFYWLCWGLIGVFAWYRIVLPSNHPGPDPAGVRATIEVLGSQLWIAAATPPHWLTWSCVVLSLAGAVAAIASRRVGLVVAAVLSWALIFVPLGRNLTHDGLTGARYFVLALPLLAVLAAQLGEWLPRLLERLPARVRPLATGLGLAALLGVESIAAQPAWRHETTFQAEYRFLAEQLGERPLDGCTLWFVPPRQPTGEPDLDCCLAPDRSPLTLVAPGLAFRPIPARRDPDDAEGCHLYYVGSLCSIEPELVPRVPQGVARIHEQCDRLRARSAEAWARQEVTDVSLQPRWSRPPVVELFGRAH